MSASFPRIVLALATVAVLAVLGAAPAAAAPAQVRAFGAVPGATRFSVSVDGKVRGVRIAYEEATRRFGLAAGRHVVAVRNAKGVRIARATVTVRNDEKVTLAIVGTNTRPAIAAVREASPIDASHRWGRLANLVPGRRIDLSLAGQPFTLVKGLNFARTSRNFVVPRSSGAYNDPGRVLLAVGGSTTVLDIQGVTLPAGGTVTLVALPEGKSDVRLRALPV